MLKKVVLVLLLLTLLLTPTLFAAPKQVTILHTNDTQGIIAANKQKNELGFVKLTTLVSKLKTKNATILLDGGDSVAKGVLAEEFYGESAVKAMNKVNYDALVAGGSEISYGYYQLLQLNRLSNFPILSANIRKDGGLVLPPYTVIERAGVKFAVLGLTSTDIKYKDMITGLKILNPVDVAKEYLPKLEPNVDFTIALTNLTNEKVIEQLTGFDLVIKQKSELKRLRAIEKIELAVEGSKVKKLDSTLIKSKNLMQGKQALVDNQKLKFLSSYYNNADYHLPEIDEEALDKAVEKLNKTMLPSQISKSEILKAVQRNKEDKPKNRKQPKVKEAFKQKETKVQKQKPKQKLKPKQEEVKVKVKDINAKQLIADSIANKIGVNLVLVSSEKVNCSKQDGKAVIKLPEREDIIVKRISGTTLREALEKAVASYPNANDEFLQLAGIEVKFDANKPSNNRVVYVKVNGKELHNPKEYKVAFNSSVLNEGSRYLSLLEDEPTIKRTNISLKKALEEYIALSREDNTPPQVTGSIKQITLKKDISSKYIVKEGDTLWEIANKFDITIDRLLEYNQISNPDLIIVGQTIYIP